MSKKNIVSVNEIWPLIKAQLDDGRQASLIVSGMSMWPFLCHGRDQVILANRGKERLRLGDIVFYQNKQGDYILHRIIRIKAGKIQTAGDALLNADEAVWPDQIKVRVKSIMREGQKISIDSGIWHVLGFLWAKTYQIRGILLWMFDILRGT